jgi:betaine-aldehyde dehydrogenase
MGKPIIESEFDVADAATCFEYYGGLATKITGDVNPVPDDALSLTLKEPVGRVRPDHPVELPAADGGVEDRAGVVRGLHGGAEAGRGHARSPRSSWRASSMGIEELPKGVVNVVTGDGPATGRALAASSSVDKVAFTGSTRHRTHILRSGGRVQPQARHARAGGQVAQHLLRRRSVGAGGRRRAVRRVREPGRGVLRGIAHPGRARIHDRFLEAVVRRRARSGSAIRRPRHAHGPAGARGAPRARGRLRRAGPARGARLVLGGGRPGGDLEAGAYLEPTIFTGVDPGMTIAREEIFGPVVSVIPFEGEADALEIANATPYGLAGAVWTRDIFRAFRVVRKLKAGIVWVNHMQPTYVEAPWGGMKMSGAGRELGRYGVENYLELKQVHVNLNDAPMGWYS